MRNYIRKSERGKTSPDVLKQAAEDVLLKNVSIRRAAKNYELSHGTLGRLVKKVKATSPSSAAEVKQCLKNESIGYSKHAQVFTHEQEEALSGHIKLLCDIYIGLTPMDIRQLAFKCAVTNGLTVPWSWRRDEKAGRDWFLGFIKRQKDLPIQCTESKSNATSLKAKSSKSL